MSGERKKAYGASALVTRRGYHPHFHHADAFQHVTFRLADSVPAELIDTWRAELSAARTTEFATDSLVAALRERIERYSDAGYGACWLGTPEVAAVVASSLRHFDRVRYSLDAWSIMPNHVHVLVKADMGYRLADVVQGWKSWTARQANRLLARTGTFWAPDYFDRFVRDSAHLDACRTYIRENPVVANLVSRAEDWRWSSASTGPSG